jgi:fructose/tagatose bisphosphate aldolase
MPVPGEHESLAHYSTRTAELVAYAHAHGVAVEAEVGTLPFGGDTDASGDMTDPQAAADFVAWTGIDLLAISAGNVHVLLEGRRSLDLERIAAVYTAASVPLVLHGGTGIDDDSLREAVKLGVAKVNYGTFLKQTYLLALHMALHNRDANPHQLLGMGGAHDVMVAGRHAVRDAVLSKMDVLGCKGRA